MISPALAEFSVWATAVLWNLIALGFFTDCLRVHARTSRQFRNAVEVGNGRVLVATYRKGISLWFVIGSGIVLIVGLVRALQLTIDPPPIPEFRIYGAIISAGVIVAICAFWRCKRLNLGLQKALDSRRYEETGRS